MLFWRYVSLSLSLHRISHPGTSSCMLYCLLGNSNRTRNSFTHWLVVNLVVAIPITWNSSFFMNTQIKCGLAFICKDVSFGQTFQIHACHLVGSHHYLTCHHIRPSLALLCPRDKGMLYLTQFSHVGYLKWYPSNSNTSCVTSCYHFSILL